MSFTLSSTPREYKPKPTGQLLARLDSIIDLGTQKSEWKGVTKELRKILFIFETPEHTEVFKEENGEQPYTYSVEFTASMGDRGNLKAFISDWTGKKLTDDEAFGFDFETLFDHPAIITVEEVVGKTDPSKTFAKLTKISAPVVYKQEANKFGMQVIVGVDQEKTDNLLANFPEALNERLVFKLAKNPEEIDFATLNKLPKWIQDKIGKAKELEPTIDQTNSAEEFDVEDIDQEKVLNNLPI
jgi:hypothetical protein